MANNVRSTGPVLIWVAYQPSDVSAPPMERIQSPGNPPPPDQDKVPHFLGTAEEYPIAEHYPRLIEFQCDQGGHQAFDMSFQGTGAIISLNLTYWDEVVAARLERTPSPAAGFRGNYDISDVGTLLISQGMGLDIWLVYSAQPNHDSLADLIPGYHYLNCVFRGPWLNRTGSRPMKRQMIFQALPVNYEGNWLLYDSDMSRLPAGGLQIPR